MALFPIWNVTEVTESRMSTGAACEPDGKKNLVEKKSQRTCPRTRRTLRLSGERSHSAALRYMQWLGAVNPNATDDHFTPGRFS
jgi:hypothetical protein